MSDRRTVLVVFGTRPEAITLVPVITALLSDPAAHAAMRAAANAFGDGRAAARIAAHLEAALGGRVPPQSMYADAVATHAAALDNTFFRTVIRCRGGYCESA